MRGCKKYRNYEWGKRELDRGPSEEARSKSFEEVVGLEYPGRWMSESLLDSG